MVDTVAKFYQCDHFWVYCSILVFDLLSPMSFPAGSFVAHYGCKSAILVAAVCTGLGGWIKALWLTPEGQTVGQVVMAVAHVFGAVAVPVFSAIWFPSSQRAISTSILFFATILGGGSGFIFGPWVTQSDPARLPHFLLLHAGLGTLLCLPAAFIQAKPPTPPSRSAEVVETQMPTSFTSDLNRALANPQFLLLLWGFCLGFAVLNTVAIAANDLFTTFGYSNMELGVIGCATVLCGMLGCTVTSYIIDQTDCHRESLLVCNATAGVLMLLLFFNMRPNNFAGLASTVCCAAFFGLSPFPVAYELACDVLFPMHPAIASCILTVFGQWLSICMTALEYYAIPDKANAPLYAAVLYVFVVAIFSFFHGELKRRRLDRGEGCLLAEGHNVQSYDGLGYSGGSVPHAVAKGPAGEEALRSPASPAMNGLGTGA
eukprot:EG_transcript_9367